MAGTSYDNNGYDGERYERYNFNATEDDYIVADILVNFESLILKFNSTEPVTCSFNSGDSYQPSWSIKARNLGEPLWHKKKKRSVLELPPSPPPLVVEMKKNEEHKFENIRITDVKTGEKKESAVYSPSSPLSYERNDHNIQNNIQSTHQLKNKSKKRNVKDWEEHVKELEQTRQQLKVSSDEVRKYLQTLMELNTILKAKRDEKYGQLKTQNVSLQVNLNFQAGHPQFPIIARQQQQQQDEGCSTYQQGGAGPVAGGYQQDGAGPAAAAGGSMTFQYYSVPFFQANDKALLAAEARHRRKIKINTKKNSNSLGKRSSIS